MFVASELTHENSASSDTSDTSCTWSSGDIADKASATLEPLQASGHAAARAPSISDQQPSRQQSEFQGLLAFALKTLARREHSTVELRRKLGAYSIGAAGRARQAEDAAMLDWPIDSSDVASTDLGTDAHIDRVIEALQLDGSLSDERFAAEFVRQRIGKGYGPIRIRMDLLERGVPDRLAEEQLTRPSEFWQQQAAEVCLRKFGRTDDPVDAAHSKDSRGMRLGSDEAPAGNTTGQFEQGITRDLSGIDLEEASPEQMRQVMKERKAASQRRWNRCARFLSQRGFPADLIYRTLDGRLLD